MLGISVCVCFHVRKRYIGVATVFQAESMFKNFKWKFQRALYYKKNCEVRKQEGESEKRISF